VTREDIIRLAREAGLTQKPFCRWGGYLDDLMRFAALVAAAEREACAKVCETEGSVDDLPEHYADAIRSRGEVQP
jgi:hypothetical protein